MSNLNFLIKSPTAQIFRRAYIKRRDEVTGFFEDDWQEITPYIKKFGKLSQKVDDVKLNKFTFGNVKIVCDNEDGLFNPSTDEASLWYGYLNQQRTLFKVEAGYIDRQQREDGVWINNEFPSESLWDESFWDADSSLWDASTGQTLFVGIISGDIPLSDSNEVTFNIRPLNSVLQDYPARNLTGWTSTGFTASNFIQMVMNQTDGSSNYIFLPFFDNNTANWEWSTTSIVYSQLNTITAAGVYDKTVWEVIERLAEVENYVPYVNREGKFRFVSRNPNTTTVGFEFHGAGSFNSSYGQTIKKLSSYGSKISKFYSRVEVKFVDEDTSTSYVWQEGSFSISPNSNAWVLGVRTLKVENFYIPNTATANTIASTLFTEYSSLRNEIEFTTSFIPHLDLLDRTSIYYDPSEVQVSSLWDQNNWAADDTSTSLDLVFDASVGDAIRLSGQEFKFLSIEIDLDNLENKFIAREV